MRQLTKTERTKGRVVYAALIFGLLMQRACKAAGLSEDQPAVQQSTLLISELLDPLAEDVRAQMLRNIQKQRILLTADTEKMDVGSALLGVINVLCSDTFKSRPGTRFDFMRQTIRQNREVFEMNTPHVATEVARFEALFKTSLFKV